MAKPRGWKRDHRDSWTWELAPGEWYTASRFHVGDRGHKSKSWEVTRWRNHKLDTIVGCGADLVEAADKAERNAQYELLDRRGRYGKEREVAVLEAALRRAGRKVPKPRVETLTEEEILEIALRTKAR